MSSTKNNGKIVLFALVALIGGVAGYGYFSASTTMKKEEQVTATKAPAGDEQKNLLKARPADIILGDSNALTTIVEYASLSCTHCAHFATEELPKLEKDMITTGKVKLVMRHFPLNKPAAQAAMIVECAGQNGLNRENFVKTFFAMQSQWAFDENYLKNLKQIASVGGIDSATFDSCIADKALETKILSGLQEAQEKLKVDSTPTFFINGEHYTGNPSATDLEAAVKAAEKAEK